MLCFLRATALACSVMLAATESLAAYPDQAVHLIVPLAPGGPSDTAARSLAQALAKALALPVIVENRPGANGALAVQALMRSAPDGYTLLWAIGSMAAIPLLQRNAPFESFTELEPVSTAGQFVFCFFVNPKVAAGTLGEFVGYAKAHPGAFNYASSTMSEYMAAAQFSKAAGIEMVRVPYKGGAQALPDLLSDRVQANFAPLSAGLNYARDGKLRALGCLAPQRTQALPNVPTFAEAGFGIVDVPTWQAVFAPPGTPGDIVARLSAEIGAALRDPTLRAEYERQNFHGEASTPAQLRQRISTDLRAWAQFMKDNGVERE